MRSAIKYILIIVFAIVLTVFISVFFVGKTKATHTEKELNTLEKKVSSVQKQVDAYQFSSSNDVKQDVDYTLADIGVLERYQNKLSNKIYKYYKDHPNSTDYPEINVKEEKELFTFLDLEGDYTGVYTSSWVIDGKKPEIKYLSYTLGKEPGEKVVYFAAYGDGKLQSIIKTNYNETKRKFYDCSFDYVSNYDTEMGITDNVLKTDEEKRQEEEKKQKEKENQNADES